MLLTHRKTRLAQKDLPRASVHLLAMVAPQFGAAEEVADLLGRADDVWPDAHDPIEAHAAMLLVVERQQPPTPHAVKLIRPAAKGLLPARHPTRRLRRRARARRAALAAAVDFVPVGELQHCLLQRLRHQAVVVDGKE